MKNVRNAAIQSSIGSNWWEDGVLDLRLSSVPFISCCAGDMVSEWESLSNVCAA